MKVVLLIFFWIFSLQSIRTESCEIDEIIEKENKLILSADNYSHVFSIYVFHKEVSIPNRYVLILHSVDTTVVFGSAITDQLNYQKAINCNALKSLLGRIEIGNREQCEICEKSTMINEGFELIEEEILAKLIYRTYIDLNNKNKRLTIISNDNLYLSIVDENPYLAKFILNQLKVEESIEDIRKKYRENTSFFNHNDKG